MAATGPTGHISAISVVFPCYRDEHTIGGLVERALEVLPTVCDDYEVVVVDDGSPDGAGAVLDELERLHPGRVRTVRHAANQGYGAAVRAGLRAAAMEFVFYTDGDGQYDVSELPSLVARMEEGISLVNGRKRARRDSAVRVVVGLAYREAMRRAFGLRVSDVNCDFRLVRADLLRQVDLTVKGGGLGVELVRKLQDRGAVIREVPVSHHPRAHGSSTFFRPGRIAGTLAELGGLWWALRKDRRRG